MKLRVIAGASRPYFSGSTAIASTSNRAPGRASCGTPIAVLAGGADMFTYFSRTSRMGAGRFGVLVSGFGAAGCREALLANKTAAAAKLLLQLPP